MKIILLFMWVNKLLGLRLDLKVVLLWFIFYKYRKIKFLLKLELCLSYKRRLKNNGLLVM